MALSLKHRLLRAGVGTMERAIGLISREAWLKTAVSTISAMNLVSEAATARGPVRFWCDSETARIRARGMTTREPDTLRWIETMTPDDVLLDVGCNVGVFSLYAAVGARARVIAIDPLPFNIAGLARNARLNGVTDRISPFCLALTDRTRVADLFMWPDTSETGGAGSAFGAPVDNYGNAYEVEYRLGTMGFALDDLFTIFELPSPSFVKIDVDGSPLVVLDGAKAVLSRPAVRHMMCEIPPGQENFDAVVSRMTQFGFRHVRTTRASPNQGLDLAVDTTNNFFAKDAQG